jgi:hypothetical protein
MVEKENAWILDSGSSNHISDRLDDFFEFEQLEDEIVWGQGNSCSVKGKGKVLCYAQIGKRLFGMRLNDVLYVPNFGLRVMSIGAAAQNGWKFQIIDGGIVGRVDGKDVLCTEPIL